MKYPFFVVYYPETGDESEQVKISVYKYSESGGEEWLLFVANFKAAVSQALKTLASKMPMQCEKLMYKMAQ